ncbi:hypothetical protein [Falsiroseomonas tokyonensis]|uniref:Uncharacterized protein n=1 Tax=Falsiroseomonas tokyonensis TaxID=430521 RepID=A0ABV7BSX0_9PROT|nr:hypothetical protein [Falsiroseomonas tokyonensis]MBU8538722.1 hypothetical protein [Falsiroseomonas tokyonensis]
MATKLGSLDWAERDVFARALPRLLAAHGLTWDDILRDAPAPVLRCQVPPRGRFWWELMPPREAARQCLVWPALFNAAETSALVDVVLSRGRLPAQDRDFILRMAVRVPTAWPETW